MRKSQFSTLTDPNPWFSRPWDIFCQCHLHKKSFGQNNFWIFMHGFKSAISPEWKIAKNEIFSKRNHKISKNILNLSSYKYLASLESKYVNAILTLQLSLHAGQSDRPAWGLNCRVKIALTYVMEKWLVWELGLKKHFGKAIFHCVWAKRRSH